MRRMDWFRCYSEIKDDPKMLALTDRQFRTWINVLAMASQGRDRGVTDAYPSRGLAAALHVTPEEFEETIDVFRDLGMVQVQQDGPNVSIEVVNFSKRHYEKPSDSPEQTAERKRRSRERQAADMSRDVTPLVTRHVTPSHATDTDTDTDTEQRLNPPTPKGALSSVQEVRFETFWTAYPKKSGKGSARSWWLRNKPSAELVDQMLTSIEGWKRSLQWQKAGGQFIPNPSTWLNQTRWEDEIPPPATADELRGWSGPDRSLSTPLPPERRPMATTEAEIEAGVARFLGTAPRGDA